MSLRPNALLGQASMLQRRFRGRISVEQHAPSKSLSIEIDIESHFSARSAFFYAFEVRPLKRPTVFSHPTSLVLTR
jgi:hypothetical protein